MSALADGSVPMEIGIGEAAGATGSRSGAALTRSSSRPVRCAATLD
jgi:hypothetical protein